MKGIKDIKYIPRRPMFHETVVSEVIKIILGFCMCRVHNYVHKIGTSLTLGPSTANGFRYTTYSTC